MQDDIEFKDLPKSIVRELFFSGFAAGLLFAGVLLFVLFWLSGK